MTPAQQAKVDQAIAEFAEFMPSVCWQMYSGLLAQGFSDAQSLELVKTYVLATMGKAK